MELFDISTETILKSLWFACSSSSQTYERTKLSRQNPITHLWRIFTGKVGELFFLEYLWKKGFIKDDEYAKLEENSLSVWWKKHNVDLCDIKIGNYLIDVKTLPESTHRYLIIPKDQYDNNPKDFYFCLILFHNLSGEKVKEVFQLNCQLLYELIMFREKAEEFVKNKNLRVKIKICGFVEHKSRKWEFVSRDVICPEHPCYRILLNDLKPFDDFKKLIKKNILSF
ncbi:MAG: hypothetical protein PWQ78_921 [Petrotoga sp.]|nr:hypothetical protein [Petrotoga sp.]